MTFRPWILFTLIAVSQGLLFHSFLAGNIDEVVIKNSEQLSSSKNLAVYTHLDPTLDRKVVFNYIVESLQNCGKVEILSSDSDLSAFPLDPHTLLDIRVQRISEGRAPNFGKVLPVFKVEVMFTTPDSGGCTNFKDQEEYVEMADSSTYVKVKTALKVMIQNFKQQYTKIYPEGPDPIFYINIPQELTLPKGSEADQIEAPL